jgi:flagellar biosynthesis anti-sigma factor FlgM
MKIVSTVSPERSKATRPNKARADNDSSPPPRNPSAGDQVRISPIAMQLAEEISQTDDPRRTSNTTRLEELRRQLEDGSYPLDPERIADAILEEEL